MEIIIPTLHFHIFLHLWNGEELWLGVQWDNTVEGLVQSKYSIKGNDDGVNVHDDDNDADEWNDDLHYGDTI